jgi:hypothetical protein
MFPPDPNDIIHRRRWKLERCRLMRSGIQKMLGDPYDGYSPDINSGGCTIQLPQTMYIQLSRFLQTNPNTIQAWKYMLFG